MVLSFLIPGLFHILSFSLCVELRRPGIACDSTWHLLCLHNTHDGNGYNTRKQQWQQHWLTIIIVKVKMASTVSITLVMLSTVVSLEAIIHNHDDDDDDYDDHLGAFQHQQRVCAAKILSDQRLGQGRKCQDDDDSCCTKHSMCQDHAMSCQSLQSNPAGSETQLGIHSIAQDIPHYDPCDILRLT